MAVLALSPARATRTPGRPRRKHSIHEAATEPPQKKRKYIPGGPGGGGRYLNGQSGSDGPDEPPLDAPMILTAPRARSARQGSEKAVNRSSGDDGESPVAARSTMQTRPRRERPERYVPSMSTPRPRYSSSAAAAAAASQASDGYKPREERSWEDFHPDLEIELSLPIYTADEVDGRTKKEPPKALWRSNSGEVDAKPVINGDVDMTDAENMPELHDSMLTPMKRKPGRPPRRPESMLSGLGSPPAPRIIPLPTHNPKERLNLPKPSYRHYNHFLRYEENSQENKKNYVDRTMANVGYQESDRYDLPPKVLVRLTEAGQIDDEAEVGLRLESDGPAEVTPSAPVVGRVEYDMDEQDVAWLESINEQRKSEGVDAIKPAIFEITMTQIEKEYHALEKRIPKPQPRHAQLHRPRSSSQAAVNGDTNPPGDEPDSKCAICDDGDCENANAIIFCDGCDLAVHQECYGVPFIPEGQWFCRKCREIGRGTPTCIFCPNVDGAFKQTSTLRWSHLLCAIWIPEVTVANPTFMEPITDVDKVPKQRWKLHCYICNQKMGACIQCGNKNCYQAFHVTCARRGRLFLKMKSPHQQGIDTTALKAFCDKHVPPEWRRMHDTDSAIVEAKRWYRHAMKDRRWADSQTAALELGAPPPPDGGLATTSAGEDDTIAVTKRRKVTSPKQMWRLPSGAPVVPAVVYSTVEASLARFTIRKRKEFVEKVCRYWTLKREARRGAALLKRLQLQLEGFSSMEVTRRNFAAMGAVGRPRLERRIQFGEEILQRNMEYERDLARMVRKREELRLEEVLELRALVDAVYFPVSALLWPIWERCRKLDEKTHMFAAGLDALALQLRERFYTSVSGFSDQLSRVLTAPFIPATAPTTDEEELEISAAEDSQPDPSPPADLWATLLSSDRADVRAGIVDPSLALLTPEQREIRKLAKRIARAVKDPLAMATRKEAELTGSGEEEILRRLEGMGLFANSKNRRTGSDISAEGGAEADDVGDEDGDADAEGEDDVVMAEADDEQEEEVTIATRSPRRGKKSTPASETANSRASSSGNGNSGRQHTRTLSKHSAAEPISPPPSTSPASNILANSTVQINGTTIPVDSSKVHGGEGIGGIPWYLAPFDPVGTTVHEERYTGREVLRGMSEELSDMDEDTLTELVGADVEMSGTPGKGAGVAGISKEVGLTKKAPKRKAKSAGWGRRRR